MLKTLCLTIVAEVIIMVRVSQVLTWHKGVTTIFVAHDVLLFYLFWVFFDMSDAVVCWLQNAGMSNLFNSVLSQHQHAHAHGKWYDDLGASYMN